MKTMTRISVAFMAILLLAGCKDDDNPVNGPEPFRQTIYEYLKEKGNYDLFLQGIDRAGYKEALEESGKYAVFAPNDEAVQRYITKEGKSSLQEFNLADLKVVIGYHLLNFSSKQGSFETIKQTVNTFNQTINGESSGICYKYETMAQAEPKGMKDPVTGENVRVYQQSKFLPVISTNLLRLQESINYEADYKQFFPSVKWQGDQNKIYAANAAVIGGQIVAGNGYVLPVNDVIEPLSTVYDALVAEHSGINLEHFKNFCHRIAYTEKTASDAEGDVYNYYFLRPQTTNATDFPNIANEWTVPFHDKDPEARLKYTFNCFVPTDEALDAYVEAFFAAPFSDTPLLQLYYLCKAHCSNRNTLLLPSAFAKLKDGSGKEFGLKRENLLASQFCGNGMFYAIDKVLEPAEFSMVTRPLFQYPRFSTMLTIGHKQNAYADMTDPDRNFTLFVVSDSRLNDNYGYRVNYSGNPASKDVIGKFTIEKWTSQMDHTRIDMTASEMQALSGSYVAEGYIDADEDPDKRIFYPSKNKFHFFYTQYGQIFGEDQTAITPNETWKYAYPNGSGKGVVYEIDDLPQYNTSNMGMALLEMSYKYQKFYTALKTAGLLTESIKNTQVVQVQMDWLNGKRYILFAPADDAWDETKIPADVQQLAEFLKSFFVPVEDNNLSDYILPQYGTPGEYSTMELKAGGEKSKLKITFVDDKQLKVQHSEGAGALTDTDVPYFATDGVIFGLSEIIIP